MNYRAYRRCDRSWYFICGFDCLDAAKQYLLDFHAGSRVMVRNIRGELVWKQASDKEEGN